MRTRSALLCATLLLGATLGRQAYAGIVVEVRDPRYFERQQQIIFPNAEVKVVAFEFEAPAGDERGKLRAKELHGQFLARIHDVAGGAIITYVSPAGQRIQNYRFTAAEVASEQKAQITVWGRILVSDQRSLLKSSIQLVEPPPGISAQLAAPPGTGGLAVIDAPVTQKRIDFSTLENDIMPLAHFLSGLMRYYKATGASGTRAVRWLRSSIEDFERYIALTPEALDRTSRAEAQTYVARAYVRLASAQPGSASAHLAAARVHAADAARLNPYQADLPTVQAVVGALQRDAPASIRASLTRAVSLGPSDTNARLNLAVFEGSQLQIDAGLRQLGQAEISAREGKERRAVVELRQQLERARPR